MIYRRVTLGTTDPQGKTWDDLAQVITIFKGPGATGQSRQLGGYKADDPSAVARAWRGRPYSLTGDWNDATRSVHVPDGFRVRFFEARQKTVDFPKGKGFYGKVLELVGPGIFDVEPIYSGVVVTDEREATWAARVATKKAYEEYLKAINPPTNGGGGGTTHQKPAAEPGFYPGTTVLPPTTTTEPLRTSVAYAPTSVTPVAPYDGGGVIAKPPTGGTASAGGGLKGALPMIAVVGAVGLIAFFIIRS